MRELTLGARAAWTPEARRIPLGLGAVCLVSTLVLSWLEGRAHPVHGSYGALFGAVFGFVVPIYTYSIAHTLLASGERLEPWARFGADRRRLSWGSAAVAWAWCAGVALLASVFALLVTGSPSAAGWSADLVTTGGIALFGATTYLVFFAAWGTFGRGVGAGVAFLLDWLLGSGSNFGALAFPRGHLRSLLGGEAVFGLGQLESSAVLVALLVCASLGFVARTPR